MPEFKQKTHAKLKTSPMKETSPQVSGSSTEPFLENQTGSTPVQSLSDSKRLQSEIQRHETDMTDQGNGDDHISPHKITTSHIEEQLVRDDITNELYMPLSSTIVLKRKKEMLYVLLDSKIGLTIYAIVHSGAYIRAIARLNCTESNNKPPPTSSKSMTLPIFRSKSQMAS